MSQCDMRLQIRHVRDGASVQSMRRYQLVVSNRRSYVVDTDIRMCYSSRVQGLDATASRLVYERKADWDQQALAGDGNIERRREIRGKCSSAKVNGLR